VFERGEAPLKNLFPLMQRKHLPIMERGIKGVRSINNLAEN